MTTNKTMMSLDQNLILTAFMKNPVCAYQIFYDDETRGRLDPGFLALDNAANPRPDWREYWPIRNFFIANPNLDESTYYGFLSPKFREKTGLAAEEVIGFIEKYRAPADVFSFSPFFDQMAMFLNIFEQGDAHHAGLMDCARKFLAILGLDDLLLSQIGHSRNTIYCNYFFAKPAFWRQWLAINEALFTLCEGNATALARRLNAGTDHAGTSSCPLKVFLVERTASLLLLTGSYTCNAFNPIGLPRTNSPAAKLGNELIIADALKQAFVATEDNHYLQAFHAYRATVMQKIASN